MLEFTGEKFATTPPTTPPTAPPTALPIAPIGPPPEGRAQPRPRLDLPASVAAALMLHDIEKAGLRKAAPLLPPCDGDTGGVVEVSIDFGAEPKLGQPALQVPTRRLGQADLIFR